MLDASRQLFLCLSCLLPWLIPVLDEARAQSSNVETVQPFTREERRDLLSPNVAYILVGSFDNNELSLGSGTGFPVALEDGKLLVITNEHVVEGGQAFLVVENGGSEPMRSILDTPNAVLRWSSETLDLAILEVDGLDLQPLTLTADEPLPGAPMFTIGYPGAADGALGRRSAVLSPVASSADGTVRRVVADGTGARRVVQHSADTAGGNSGGPIFDECGRVIGVHYSASMRNREQVASGINNAVSVENLIAILRDQNISPMIDARTCADANDLLARSNEDLQQFRNTLIGLVGVFIVAIITLSSLLVLALRRPREAVVQFVERSVRRSSAAPERRSSGGLILDGRTGDGRPVRLLVSASDLAQSRATVGRDRSRARYIIDDPRVSRLHATMAQSQGDFFIRDENATNGTRVNGRTCHPGQPVVVKAGDSISLGGVELRVVT